jgi:hypothetical protein
LVVDLELGSLAGVSTAVASQSTTQPAPDEIFDDLPWYRGWVLQQLHSQPQRPVLCLLKIDCDETISLDQFFRVWSHTRELFLAKGPKTIDTVAETLIELGVVSAEDSYEAAQSVRDLVFSILGWQTMLYKPDFSSPEALMGYNILDETAGYRGEARICLYQSTHAAKKQLPDFLLGFGMMLPPPNYDSLADPDDQKAFAQCRTVSPKEVNAYVLKNICGLRFQWVDSLSCHLEMDKRSGTVFLYRYPSFCLYNLRQHCRGQQGDDSMQNCCPRCVLQCCAFDTRSSVPWVDQGDIVGLLQEILLSYRLLFGQSNEVQSRLSRPTPIFTSSHRRARPVAIKALQ